MTIKEVETVYVLVCLIEIDSCCFWWRLSLTFRHTVNLFVDNNSITGDMSFLHHGDRAMHSADCHGNPPEVRCDHCDLCCSDREHGPALGCFPREI